MEVPLARGDHQDPGMQLHHSTFHLVPFVPRTTSRVPDDVKNLCNTTFLSHLVVLADKKIPMSVWNSNGTPVWHVKETRSPGFTQSSRGG